MKVSAQAFPKAAEACEKGRSHTPIRQEYCQASEKFLCMQARRRKALSVFFRELTRFQDLKARK